jgi:hypothetical protein
LLTNGFGKQQKTFVFHLGEIHRNDPEMTSVYSNCEDLG